LLSGLDKDFEAKLICDGRPEFIFVFVNHYPESKVLKRKLRVAFETAEYNELSEKCDIKAAISSGMGYGLYGDCMIPLEEFSTSLKKGIKKRRL